MKLETVERLLDAGFTKDEILKFSGEEVTTNTEPEPAAQAAEPVAAEPAAHPVPATEPQQETPDYNKFGEKLSLIENSLNSLTKAIQANAIAQSVIPGGLQNQPTAEDMLAEIIRPTFKERG